MIAGRYTLGRELGRGASGAVHLGRDELLGRDVALKRLGMVPGADSPDVERARREAQVAAAIAHPHVVSVYDLVTDSGRDWLVMEYVEGATLAELIRRDGGLEPTRARALMAQVADALAAAHAMGITHRDVKPSNVFVTPDGRAKLGDFGIARGPDDAALTQTGLVTGSPAYLAPEVISGRTATPASDVWSLGATMFHALAGHPPYDLGDNLVGGLMGIVQEEPPRLDSGDAESNRILDATLVRDPEARWTSAQVAAALRGRQVRPPRPPRPVPAPAASTTAATATTRVVPSEPAPRRSGARAAWLAAAVVVVLLVAVGAFALGQRDGGDPRAQDSPDGSATTGTTGTTDPTTTPSIEPPPELSPEEIRAQMEAFIGSYLDTVTSSPEVAFTQLTPEFQAESGGLQKYLDWWRQVRSAQLLNLKADPENLTVDYTVKYHMRTGKKRTERISLQLLRHDDQYLIGGEG